MKKVPLRTCMGCNEKKPKKELVRIVKNKNDEIFLDKTLKAYQNNAFKVLVHPKLTPKEEQERQ